MNDSLITSFNIFWGTLISEDLAFVYGLFKYQESALTSYMFVLSYTLGVYIGDIGLFSLGMLARRFKHKQLIRPIAKFVERKISKYKNDQFGRLEEVLVFTRFIPGTRIPTYLFCGFSGYSFLKFSIILTVTAFVYAVVGLIIISLFHFDNLMDLHWTYRLAISVSAALATYFIFKTIAKWIAIKKKYKELKRPLEIRFNRILMPEFWPSWFFYLPFVPYFIFKFLTKGGLKSILSANPSVRLGGWIGERKSEIDELLLKFIPEKRMKQFSINGTSLIEKSKQIGLLKLNYPFYIKPDNGMRGTGVLKVNTQEQLEDYLQKNGDKDLVIQEESKYSKEWGIYYYKNPHTQKGQIFSITVKDRCGVVGDGHSSLYELALSDPELKYRFDLIFSDNPVDPHFIPKEGEFVRITLKGSHSKGCIFRDGSQYLKAPIFDNFIENLDKLEGFNIGRIDLKFNTLEGLKNGEYDIIELNGVGGESSNFYDPYMSLLSRYKIMFAQWNLIFSIGSYNKNLGNKSKDSYYELAREILFYGKV